MTTTTPTTPTTSRAPRYVLISAWATPIMVLGQFSMLAIIPVALVLIGTFRHPSLGSVRLWAGLLAAVYVAPLAIWQLRQDGAESLSKDMHPVLMVLIVAAAVAVLIKLYVRKR